MIAFACTVAMYLAGAATSPASNWADWGTTTFLGVALLTGMGMAYRLASAALSKFDNLAGAFAENTAEQRRTRRALSRFANKVGHQIEGLKQHCLDQNTDA